MALELVVREKGVPPRTHVVRKDVAFFGRREDNDIVLLHTFVSSRHGRILRRGSALLVEDMGSTNGTNLNGQPLTPMVPQPLSPTDSIEIETVVIRARLLELPEEVAAPVTYHEAKEAAAPLRDLGVTVRLSPERSAAAAAAALPSPVAPAPASFSAPSVEATVLSSAPGTGPRAEAPATMWEIQTGAALSAAARAESAEAAAPTRLGQASLPDVIASGRMLQKLRAAEEGDSFLLWELLFKGLGILAVVAGLVLMVMIFAA